MKREIFGIATCSVIFRLLIITAFLAVACAVPVENASAAGKGGKLPKDLFVDKAPGKPLNVIDARKNAKEGQSIAVRGRVGGSAKPIADKYAIFLVIDGNFKLCKDGCADLCHISRDKVTAGMATIQVVDGSGKPLKASIQGKNGLKPLSEVVVEGKVATLTDTVMIVNAEKIYVAKAAASAESGHDGSKHDHDDH